MSTSDEDIFPILDFPINSGFRMVYIQVLVVVVCWVSVVIIYDIDR